MVCIWECHLFNGESFHLINLVSPPPPSLLSPHHSCVFLLCSIITPLSASSSSSSVVSGVLNGLLFGSQPPPLPPCPVLSYHTTCIRALSLPVSPNHRTHARTERRGARGVLLLLGGVTIRTLQHTLTRFALFYERGGYILSLRDSFFLDAQLFEHKCEEMPSACIHTISRFLLLSFLGLTLGLGDGWWKEGWGTILGC